MSKLKYLLLVVLFSLFACKGESNFVPSKIDYIQFYKSWANSFEEQNNTNEMIQIFRPSDYKVFPASRYREIVTFRKDSSCTFFVLDPADAHYFENGKWKFINREINIIGILNSSDKVYKKFQILEWKSDLLKILLVD